MMKAPVLVLAATLLAACSYTTSQSRTVDARPTLSVAGAPDGSTLTVDGLAFGPAARYAPDKQAVKLEPGTHVVRIEQGGRVLQEEKVFLSEGVFKVIQMQGAGK